MPVVTLGRLQVGLGAALLAASCAVPARSGDHTKEISGYIRGLSYAPEKLLSTADMAMPKGLPYKQKVNGRDVETVIICNSKVVTLDSRLDSITMFSSTEGIIYPGALLRANRELAEGNPEPIGLPRGPLTLTLNLHQIGADGTRVVNSPDNGAVQAAIQEMLDKWFAKGHTQAANQRLWIQKAFSTQQIALSLGFNAKWDKSNSVSLDANYAQNRNDTTCVAMFRQVYFTASVKPPANPAEVFAPSVDLAEVKEEITKDAPAAYVQSVEYGRLIMIKMVTHNSVTAADATGALKYAFDGGDLEANVKATYDEIIRNSEFTVVTFGGNAEGATQVAATNVKEAQKNLPRLIKEAALFNLKNPPVPIAYKVAFLKDNKPAVMGVMTRYVEWECKDYPSGFVTMRNKGGFVAKLEVDWEESDDSGAYKYHEWWSGWQTINTECTKRLPAGATRITVKVGVNKLFTTDWVTIKPSPNVDTWVVPPNKKFLIKGTTENHWCDIEK